MARRILLVALALCLTGWGLRAAERATFILTDGHRVSGTLDMHEMTGSQLSLVPDQQQHPQTFSFDQVAMIDFAGGSPRTNELGALPQSGHMMAMRNGGMRMGYLVTITNGDTVVWQEEGGARRSIPVRLVSRIYVNPDSARSAFNYNNSYNNANAAGQNARPYPPYGQGYRNRGSQVVVSSLSVPANVPWTDTGVQVVRGDVMRFDDQGGIAFMQTGDNWTNAGGRFDIKSDKYPVQSAGVGALIGKVGTNGTPFMIGAGASPVTMPATGRLYLGVNDDNFADNSGAFSVSIIRR